MSGPKGIGDDLRILISRLEKIEQSIQDLRRPTGTNIASLVSQVSAALADLESQVAAQITAQSYTRAEIDSRIATVDGRITNPGNINPGAVSASGNISTPGAVTGSNVYATQAPGYFITGTRVAGWWESATGRAGTASSSIRFKQDLVEVDYEKFEDILDVGIYYWSYKDEVRKRDDPDYEHYVGPDYHVATNLSTMAEYLHEKGLWEFVIYEREPVVRTVIEVVIDEEGNETEIEHHTTVGDTLKLNEEGQPIPQGIHDYLLSYALVAVGKVQRDRIREMKVIQDGILERLTALEG